MTATDAAGGQTASARPSLHGADIGCVLAGLSVPFVHRSTGMPSDLIDAALLALAASGVVASAFLAVRLFARGKLSAAAAIVLAPIAYVALLIGSVILSMTGL